MVLEKWNNIIRNWINCYSDEVIDFNIKVETLNNLILHMKQNEDQAIPISNKLETFILNNYPDFLFDNGTVTAANEEEICIIASLLLFFICVNSKDVDLKNEMCNKLSMEDQEIITKFNKTLMKSSSITFKEINAAILESCGQDTASALIRQTTVAETPPVIRSLHNEVRRLQAALDAERFDRTFLQDELTRTNYKLEKILKDKEQFKAEIVSLKAKISICGQEIPSDDSNLDSHTSTIKLLRQLEEAEQRLVDNQSLLDDAIHERNIYKEKVDELKLERDKLIIVHQEESIRACTLEEQLQAVHKTNDSLKELVNELRQHNQFNQIDGSMLECDDPNASIHSIGRNLSIGSEACSNVVEVQLMEERANIIELKNQIDLLENQLRIIRKTTSDEKSEFQNELISKDYHIQHLKYEIDELNKHQFNLKDSFNDETSKLNNQINELEQKVKDYEVLHEENSSILKSLIDKESKLENEIEVMNNEILKLKDVLIKEQNSKLKMKEEYENYLMKLNEKVLNRNNELVELQNTLIKNSEVIEMLNNELRKEKIILGDIKLQFSNDITKLNEEKNGLQNQIFSLQQQLKESAISLDITKETLAKVDCLKNNLAEELNKLNHNKSQLEHELVHNKTLVHTLQDEIEKLNEYNDINKQNFESQLIDFDLNLKETSKKLNNEIHDLNKIINNLSNENNNLVKNIEDKVNEMASQKVSLNELNEFVEKIQNEYKQQKVLTNTIQETLEKEMESKKELQQNITKLNIEKDLLMSEKNEIQILNKQLSVTCNTFEVDIMESKNQLDKNLSKIEILKEEILKKEEQNEKLTKLNESSKSIIETKTHELNQEIECLNQKIQDSDATVNILINKENDFKIIIENYEEKLLEINKLTEKQSKDLIEEKNNVMIKKKEYDIKLLELQNCILNKNKEINALNSKLQEENTIFNTKDVQLNDEITKLNKAINALQQQVADKSSALEVTKDSLSELEIFKNNLMEEFDNTNELKSQLEQELEKTKILLNSLQYNETELKNKLQECINKKELLYNEIVVDKNEKEVLFVNCEKLKIDIEELKQKLDIETKEKTICKSENNMLQEKIRDKERLYQEILKSNEHYQCLINTNTQKYCKDVDDLRATLKHNENITTGLHERENELKTKMEETITYYDNIIMEKKCIIEKLTEQFKTEVENTLVNNKSYERKILNIENKNIKELEVINGELKKLQQLSNENYPKYNHELTKLNNDNNIIIKLKKADEIKPQLHEELLENKSLLNSLQNKIINLLKENKTIKNDYEIQLADIRKKYENEMEARYELEKSVTENKVILRQSEADHVKSKFDLMKQMKEKENIIATQEKFLTEQKQLNIQLAQQCEKLEIDNTEIKQQLDKEVNEKHTIEMTKIKDIEVVKEEIIKKEQKYNDLLNNKYLIETKNKEFCIEIDCLRQTLTNNEEVINKLKQTEVLLNTQLQNTIANYENKLSEINISKEKISIELKEEKVKLSIIKEEYENKILQLECEKSKIINETSVALKSLEDDYKTQIVLKENLIKDFSSERQILKNMVKVTEEVMEDQKVSFTKVIDEHIKHNQVLEGELTSIQNVMETNKHKLIEKDYNIKNCLKELNEERYANEQNLIKITKMENLIDLLKKEVSNKNIEIDRIKLENNDHITYNQEELKSAKQVLKEKDMKIEKSLKELNEEKYANKELLIQIDKLESEFRVKEDILNKNVEYLEKEQILLKEIIENEKKVLQEKNINIENYVQDLNKEKYEKEQLIIKIQDLENKTTKLKEEVLNKNMELDNITLQKDKYIQNNQEIEQELKSFKEIIKNEKLFLQQKDSQIEDHLKELKEEKYAKEQYAIKINELENITTHLKEEVSYKNKEIEKITLQKDKDLQILEKKITEINEYQKNAEIKFKEKWEILKDDLHTELLNNEKEKHAVVKLQNEIHELSSQLIDKETKIISLEQNLNDLAEVKKKLEKEQYTSIIKVSTLQNNITDERKEIENLKQNKCVLENIIKNNKSTIEDLEKQIKIVQKEKENLEQKLNGQIHNLEIKVKNLEEYKNKSEITIKAKLEELKFLNDENILLKHKIEINNDEVLKLNDKMTKELSDKETAIEVLKKENDNFKEIVQRETFGVSSQDRGYASHHRHSEDNHEAYRHTETTSSFSNISEEKDTITDLEKIILNKNRTITTLQSDLTYLKTLMAESETKLLDITKELDNSNENYQEISYQLKQLAAQKNEEIAELRKQISKMSVTENRASQIVKVSAKYQAMILKRIAEIKNVAVLKELKNFNNVPLSCDDELRRGLNAGSITMEELENFLETTDRHLRKCSEKQLALQKERDRLAEICKINDSEIVDTKKYLTELALYYKTFASVRDVYSQKLSRVVSLQRSVRRELLDCDERLDDATTAKLERGYSAALQDLCECAMNMERWVERCVDRTVAPEKIKQAFSNERVSLAGGNFQNAGLEVQLQELEGSFGRLSQEIRVARSKEGSGATGNSSATVMEVRAEYEDKLNRMKTKMKQLYQEQISIFREKQRAELCAAEEREKEAVRKLSVTSRAYEDHIRALTAELWQVGEKYLMKNDEAEWLKKHKSGSLMSLQFVNSSGLTAPREDKPRMSDTHSLHSLPVNTNKTRTLHMSDEEGEMFDNRYLKELMSTPRSQRHSPRPSVGPRLSELKWRNSLCPPHLKSSYPAETQFAPTADEDDIKNVTANPSKQRKEVGITAYKKPGPPTPSKQAGRLSATDSELREYQRQDLEMSSKKVGTPSRILGLFRSNRNDDTTGTPRRRLSLFRSNKK